MDDEWIAGYARVSANALTAEWFVSPLEYLWPDGRTVANAYFHDPYEDLRPELDDVVSAAVYRCAMVPHFRAQMTVLTYMRQTTAQSFAWEIEHAIYSLYGLDFRAAILQLIPVAEAYTRALFGTNKASGIQPSKWKLLSVGDALRDKAREAVRRALGRYLEKVFEGSSDQHTTNLRRNLVLHGNARNRAVYSQKNALVLLFVVDALVFIEMLTGPNSFFDQHQGDAEKIKRREDNYLEALQHAFTEYNQRKLAIFSEHDLNRSQASRKP